MSATNPKVDAFFDNAVKWRDEFRQLRKIVLGSGLTETLKWRQPCYTWRGSNVAIISGFKDYCVLAFFKGALLTDDQGILTRPGANTQAVRQARFTGVGQITKMLPTLKAFLQESIQAEEAGLRVERKAEIVIPAELRVELDADAAFRAAFEALTPGRQRAYTLFFSAPKLSATRTSRVEKHRHRILAGKGLNDR